MSDPSGLPFGNILARGMPAEEPEAPRISA